MTLVRTHYIIDLVGGLIIASYVHYLAEKLSFYVDVKLTGVSGERRARNYFKPCKCCGWANKNVADFIDSEEIKKIK